MNDKTTLIPKKGSPEAEYGGYDNEGASGLENNGGGVDKSRSGNAKSKSSQSPQKVGSEPESQKLQPSAEGVPRYVEEAPSPVSGGDRQTGSKTQQEVEDDVPWWRIMAEVFLPFLCAGFGLCAAGMYLDFVQVVCC